MQRDLLVRVLAELTFRERRILALRFGMVDGEECTLEAVGSDVGVTRVRVPKLEREALD
jgi:RNA polymerase primary sigma factor